MNNQQERAVAMIIGILAALPWQERAEVFAVVKTNDSICVNCGMATEEYGCQCDNDE